VPAERRADCRAFDQRLDFGTSTDTAKVRKRLCIRRRVRALGWGGVSAKFAGRRTRARTSRLCDIALACATHSAAPFDLRTVGVNRLDALQAVRAAQGGPTSRIARVVGSEGHYGCLGFILDPVVSSPGCVLTLGRSEKNLSGILEITKSRFGNCQENLGDRPSLPGRTLLPDGLQGTMFREPLQCLDAFRYVIGSCTKRGSDSGMLFSPAHGAAKWGGYSSGRNRPLFGGRIGKPYRSHHAAPPLRAPVHIVPAPFLVTKFTFRQ